MLRTKKVDPKPQITIARRDCIMNILAYNNVMTESYLEKLSNEQLLCLVHPSDREQLTLRMGINPKKDWAV